MDIIQSETNRGKKSVIFDDHTYRFSFGEVWKCTLEAKFPDKNTSWQLVASFVPEQTCNFYEYLSDFMIVYNKWTSPVLLWCEYRILPKCK
jgi:hypothetical protein